MVSNHYRDNRARQLVGGRQWGGRGPSEKREVASFSSGGLIPWFHLRKAPSFWGCDLQMAARPRPGSQWEEGHRPPLGPATWEGACGLETIPPLLFADGKMKPGRKGLDPVLFSSQLRRRRKGAAKGWVWGKRRKGIE